MTSPVPGRGVRVLGLVAFLLGSLTHSVLTTDLLEKVRLLLTAATVTWASRDLRVS